MVVIRVGKEPYVRLCSEAYSTNVPVTICASISLNEKLSNWSLTEQLLVEQ